jgi:hypothetical protein
MKRSASIRLHSVRLRWETRIFNKMFNIVEGMPPRLAATVMLYTIVKLSEKFKHYEHARR